MYAVQIPAYSQIYNQKTHVLSPRAPDHRLEGRRVGQGGNTVIRRDRGLWELLCRPSQSLRTRGAHTGLQGATRLRCHFAQNKGRVEGAKQGLLDASLRWD